MSEINNEWENITVKMNSEKGVVPPKITFETKDIVELLTMVDSSLQPDFPVNKIPILLQNIKSICLKYGINWTGRAT